jgi:hypothetical protein
MTLLMVDFLLKHEAITNSFSKYRLAKLDDLPELLQVLKNSKWLTTCGKEGLRIHIMRGGVTIEERDGKIIDVRIECAKTKNII